MQILENIVDYFLLFSWWKKAAILIALFSFFAQLYYYFNVFGRVAFIRLNPKKKHGEQTENIPMPPVSVIICARNEHAALEQHLSRILEQDYPLFEVIVVNDCSTDDSEILLASMQEKYPHLMFRTLVESDIFKHGKKMALGVGIKAAQYDLLLFTNADCYPQDNDWLRNMASRFSDKKDIALGYTRLVNNRRWIRADRLMQALHCFGKALKGKPYMGMGSNLAYRKKLFFDNKGFDIRIIGSLREDYIFINKVATRGNTAVAALPKNVNISALRISSLRWRNERYNELHSFALCRKGSRYPELAEVLSRLLFFASATVGIALFYAHPTWLSMFAGAIILRWLVQWFVFFRVQRRLNEKGLLSSLFIWDFAFPFIYLILLFVSKISRKKSGGQGIWN
ncbi:MAG: glycosyltransferase [Prevotellaceae bacterium]|jgi:cellulose synthase/poly-beta-1,6-N-acetylglucosamine synthase-like glycosyltransferase|nr:glycosyltransferase [Prevotellaceae bacterium]